MEIEWFCHDDAEQWFEFWCDVRRAVGITQALHDNVIMRHDADELAHYAKGCGTFDVEYRFPFTAPGYGELEGVAPAATTTCVATRSSRRETHLLRSAPQRAVPAARDRTVGWTVPRHARHAVRGVRRTGGPARSTWRSTATGPIKAAIFPLVNKDGMPEMTAELHERRDAGGRCGDAKQSIGKRYADGRSRLPSFFIDSDSLTDQTVTIRHRDGWPRNASASMRSRRSPRSWADP